MTRVREMPRAGVGARDAGPAEPKLDGAGPTGRTVDQVVVSEPDVLPSRTNACASLVLRLASAE